MIVFFFQAEDGIRDAQESRGLGDVYKRQLYPLLIQNSFENDLLTDFKLFFISSYFSFGKYAPVSYTHLTLPTIYSV